MVFTRPCYIIGTCNISQIFPLLACSKLYYSSSLFIKNYISLFCILFLVPFSLTPLYIYFSLSCWCFVVCMQVWEFLESLYLGALSSLYLVFCTRSLYPFFLVPPICRMVIFYFLGHNATGTG